MKLLNLVFTFVFAFAFHSQLVAENAPAEVAVRGRLRERGTKRPLADVNVFLIPGGSAGAAAKQPALKAVSNSSGEFAFEKVGLGEWKIVVNIADFSKLEKAIQVKENLKSLELYPEPSSSPYFETTITDIRARRDDSQKSLSQSEFLKMPGSGGDPIRAVQNLPGVNRAAGFDARVAIQGGDPEDTRYNINGHEVPIIFHFGGLSSVVTPEAVQSVDFFSAGYGPEYSRSIGGHIGLAVRRPRLDRTHGLAFVDLFNAGGLIEGPIGQDSGYLVSGRYSYLGEVLKQVAKSNEDFSLTVAPVFYDVNGEYFKKLAGRDEFRFFTIASKDRLELALKKPLNNEPDLRGNFEQETKFYRFIPQWSRSWGDKSRLSFSLGAGENLIFADAGDKFLKISTQNLTVRSDYEKAMSSRWKINAGIDNLYSRFRVHVRVPSTFSEGGVNNPISSGELRDANVTGKDTNLGFYFRNEWKPSEESRWTLLPNLRFDRVGRTDEVFFLPRVQVRYALSDSFGLNAAYGQYRQTPQPQETDNTFGNPDVDSQRAEHFAFGFSKDFRNGQTDGVQVSSTGFYKKLKNMVVPSSAFVERNGSLTAENYNNTGWGRIYGVETQVKYRFGLASVTASYTYLVSRRQQPGQAELPSPFDQTHNVNLLANYERKKWLYGARFRYVTGDPYTPIVGATYDADNDVFIPTRGALYSARNPAFYQLDIRIDRRWVYDTWILSTYLDVQNVTARDNPQSYMYAYDYSEKKSVSNLPILPTFGVKGEF